MPDPATYRPAPGSIPTQAGVYRFRDQQGQVIYVGKAKSLRQRLNSYFANVADLHPRTQAMVTTAASVEWTVVANEVEALQLEYSWIKQFDPRFNVKYRDDKSYPWLAVTISEQYPRLQVMRGEKKPGVRYFGPYSHAWAIRETLDLLLRTFPARTCSTGVFKRARQSGRACLLGYIDKCSAPCVGNVSAEQHRVIVEDFCTFLAGDTAPFLRRIEKQMQVAAAEQEYEQAARLRDDLAALHKAMERNAVVLPDATDADVIALAQDQVEAAVQVFHVRGGRVRGQRGLVVDKVEDSSTAALLARFLEQFYLSALTPDAPTSQQEQTAIAQQILLPTLPDDHATLAQVLSQARGAAVQLKVPQRGAKKDLLATVTRNAEHALALHKTKRASDLSARSAALQEIHDALHLPQAPLRIECIDISHVQGTNVVASLVVFEDGLPRKSEYRKFRIATVQGSDDVGAIAEVVRRRMQRYLQESALLSSGQPGSRIDPTTGKALKFAYPPQLLVVDGGAPQVAAAARVLRELGITGVGVCGLAKRLEEVWLPDTDFPVILPRTSEGLYLLQRVRDEAHRFAIAFHRAQRGKAATASGLDAIPGVGPARRKALLTHFGSLAQLRQASVEQIMQVPGMGRHSAKSLLAALAPPGQVASQEQAAPGPRSVSAVDASEKLDPPPRTTNDQHSPD